MYVCIGHVSSTLDVQLIDLLPRASRVEGTYVTSLCHGMVILLLLHCSLLLMLVVTGNSLIS